MKAALPVRQRPDGSIALSDTDRAALGLVTAPVVDGDVPNVVLRYGRVHPVPGEEAQIVAPVTGRISAPPAVTLGGMVRQGDLLVTIVPALAAAERITVGVQGAQLAGDIRAAQSQLAAEEAAVARARDLAASNIVSQAKLQEAEAAAAATRARLDALRQATALQVKGEGAPIALRAPIAGKVVTLETEVGASVQQGQLLARVLRAGPRWVDLFAPPEEPVGTGYELAPAQTPGIRRSWLPARLLAPGAVVENDGTRHDLLEVEASRTAGLLSRQTVSVRVSHGTAHGLVIPESALVPALPEDRAFVEVAPNTFKPVSVKVAASFDGKARIAAGLRAGDKVVVSGTMALDGELQRSALRLAD